MQLQQLQHQLRSVGQLPPTPRSISPGRNRGSRSRSEPGAAVLHLQGAGPETPGSYQQHQHQHLGQQRGSPQQSLQPKLPERLGTGSPTSKAAKGSSSSSVGVQNNLLSGSCPGPVVDQQAAGDVPPAGARSRLSVCRSSDGGLGEQRTAAGERQQAQQYQQQQQEQRQGVGGRDARRSQDHQQHVVEPQDYLQQQQQQQDYLQQQQQQDHLQQQQQQDAFQQQQLQQQHAFQQQQHFHAWPRTEQGQQIAAAAAHVQHPVSVTHPAMYTPRTSTTVANAAADGHVQDEGEACRGPMVARDTSRSGGAAMDTTSSSSKELQGDIPAAGTAVTAVRGQLLGVASEPAADNKETSLEGRVKQGEGEVTRGSGVQEAACSLRGSHEVFNTDDGDRPRGAAADGVGDCEMRVVEMVPAEGGGMSSSDDEEDLEVEVLKARAADDTVQRSALDGEAGHKVEE